MLQPVTEGLNQRMGSLPVIAAAWHIGRAFLDGANQEFQLRQFGALPAEVFKQSLGGGIGQILAADIDPQGNPQERRRELDILERIANVKIDPFFDRNRRGSGGLTDF